MTHSDIFQTCIHDENNSGILKVRIAAASESNAPKFQTQLFKNGALPVNTFIITEFEKFIRVSFSDISLVEKLGEGNRNLTFDLLVQVSLPLDLESFRDWYESNLYNLPLAVEITMNSGNVYVFAPMSVSFRHIAPADEMAQITYELKFQMMKRNVQIQGNKKKYIQSIEVFENQVTIYYGSAFSLFSFLKFGFGKSRDPKKAALFDSNTFDCPTGEFYFFALHRDGSYDCKKFTVKRATVEGIFRIGVEITTIKPADVFRIGVEITDAVIPPPEEAIFRIGVEITDTEDESGGGGGDPVGPGVISKDAYAFPPLSVGVGTLTNTGAVDRTYLKVQVFEDNDSIFFRDLTPDADWSGEEGYDSNKTYKTGNFVFQNGRYFKSLADDQVGLSPVAGQGIWQEVTATKYYTIGLMDKQVRSSYFTKRDVTEGVNIDAWRGYEVYIMSMYVIDQEDFIFGWKGQQVYIPAKTFQSTRNNNGATEFLMPPSKSFDPNNQIHRFNEYVRLPNKPDDVLLIIQTMNERERLIRDQYSKAGFLSKYATKDDTFVFVGEDLWYACDPKHPIAYDPDSATTVPAWEAAMQTKYGAGLLDYLKGKVEEYWVNAVNPSNGIKYKHHKYMMLNNELHYHWSPFWKNIVRQCYLHFRVLAPSCYLAAWRAKAISLNSDYSVAQAWIDYNRSIIEDLRSNSTAFTVAPADSYESALNVHQIGGYHLGPLITDTVNNILTLGMMFSKFLPEVKAISTNWRLQEVLDETMHLSQFERMFKGRRLRTFEKPLVSTHQARNIAIASLFVANGMDWWDDGFSMTQEPSEFIYPAFNYENDWKIFISNGDPVNNIHPSTNLDGSADGAWCAMNVADLLAAPTLVGEILVNNVWRRDGDVFPAGADKLNGPTLLYKNVNNKIVYLFYDKLNKVVKNYQIKIDGVVKTVTCYGDNVHLNLL